MPFNLEKFWYISFLICVHFVFPIISFFIIFSLVTYDSIIEYGRYNYEKIPTSLFKLSFVNALLLLMMVVSIAFYLNENLNKYSFFLLSISLANSALLDFIFSKRLGSALKNKEINDLSSVDFDLNDTKIYCIWEILFFVIYNILAFLILDKYEQLYEFAPWLILIILIY